MEYQVKSYQLNLFQLSEKAFLNTLLGAIALFVAFVVLMLLLQGIYPSGAFAGGMLLLGGGGYTGYKAYKKAAIVLSLVSITDTDLSVRDLQQDRLTLIVRYVDIASYRYQSFNGADELRMTLHTGSRVFIKANFNLAKVGDFAGMVRDFEHHLAIPPVGTKLGALLDEEPKASPTPSIVREKSFFEKPISTVGLVAFTVLLGLTIERIVVGSLPFRGNFLVVGGIYISYLAAWLAAAKQRRQP
jgi:hypothetical protein